MPPSNFRNAQDATSLLQGLNTMQMQSGLVPGGVPTPNYGQLMGQEAAPRTKTPAEFSRDLNVQFQQAQQLTQVVQPTPPLGGGVTPVPRPTPFQSAFMMPSPDLPPPSLGGEQNMARQQAIAATNETLAMGQAGVGMGMRGMADVGAFGMGAAVTGGNPLGGVMGSSAFEHFGGGQFMQDMGNRMMQPIVDQRTRALQLQGMSQQFVRGGQDLGPSGMGLSMEASNKLQTGLMETAESREFQAQTGGMFNRQDVMKISRLAGEMGMLDQSQTADDLKRDITKISKALSNFMDIVEEPNVQKAMQQMSQMRGMGMTVPETNIAARNARQFARMAGTDVGEVMDKGMEGASMFQQVGLTGGTGMRAGMAAQGMAGQAAALMNPRELALSGGQQGIARDLTAGAAQAQTLDALLPAMLTRENGRLAVDEEALASIASGDLNIQEAMRKGSRNIRQYGGREFIQEISTRKRELQDQIGGALGGQGQVLMPMIQARMMQESVPGMNLGGAFKDMGMNERQARTYEQMAQDPRFAENMMQQAQISAREQRGDVADVRANREEVTRTPAFLREAQQSLESTLRDVERGLSRTAETTFGLGSQQDVLEEQAMQGGGRILRTAQEDELGSDIRRARFRDRMKKEGADRTFARIMDFEDPTEDIRQRRRERAGAQGTAALGDPLIGGLDIAMQEMTGPEGFGFTEAGRGGEFLRDTVRQELGGEERLRAEVGRIIPGVGPSGDQITRMAKEMQETGRTIEKARRRTDEDDKKARGEASGRLREIGVKNADERADDAMSTATVAIRKAAENKQMPFGMDSLTGNLTNQEMIDSVRQELKREGYSEAEISAFTEGGEKGEFFQSALARASKDASPEVQEELDKTVGGGANVEAQTTGEMIDKFAERREKRREKVFERLGVSTGAFGASDEQRKKILDVVSGGTGEKAKARRIKLAMEAAKAADDDKKLESLRSRFMELDDEAKAEAEGAVEGLDEEVLEDIGEKTELMSVDETIQTLDKVGKTAREAEKDRVREQMTGLVGAEGMRRMKDWDSYRAYLKGGGDQGRLSDKQVKDIISGDMTQGDVIKQAELRGDRGTATAGGLTQMAQGAMLGSLGETLGFIQEGAGRGGRGPGEDTAEGGDPENFNQAVGTFSEASHRMLEAARAMSGEKSVMGLGSLLAAGDPSGGGGVNLPFAPVGLISQLLGSDEDGG